MRFRPTVRLKLTLLYGCLFLVAGAVLLGVNYALASRSLHAQSTPEGGRVGVILRQEEPAQGPSGPTEREAQGPSGPTEREAQGPSGPTEREAQGPSGPTEREAQGPSGPTEREAQGPSGPTEREAQGPSGPTEREAQGPSGPTEREAQGPSGPTEREAQLPLPGPETLVTPDGRPLEDVLREYEADLRNDTLHALLVQSSIALGAMAVVAVGLGWLVAGRALRPLQHVTTAAQRLSEANLHERLALQGPQDELKELADTFDAMLERLERAFESQRRFVANASHELRTPLTIQRTLVEVALADSDADATTLREMAMSLEDAIGRNQRLIESLLLLARSEQRLTDPEPVDLADAARLALEQTAGEAAVAGIVTTADLRPAPVAGNRALLERLVGNLVENAVRHNRPEDGWLRIETAAGDGMATVRVINSGPVVPPAEVPGLLEPFRRLGHDRVVSEKGVGLGLSIVRAVVAAHGGHLSAVARDNGGLQVTVTMPRLGARPVDRAVRAPARREKSMPWPDVSADPTARLPASAGSGEGAASPTSMPVAPG